MDWERLAEKHDTTVDDIKAGYFIFGITAGVSALCHVVITVTILLVGAFLWWVFLLYTIPMYGTVAFIYYAMFKNRKAKELLDMFDV